MNPELVAYIKARIAEREPRERELYRQTKLLEAELEELSKPYKAVRNEWSNLYTEIGNLRRMLPADVVIEEAKPPLPF